MKILVLGAGRMGHGAVYDLVHNSPDVESVTVADFHLDKAETVSSAVGTLRVDGRQIDASDYAASLDLMYLNRSLSGSCIKTLSNAQLCLDAITFCYICRLPNRQAELFDAE